MNLYEYIEKCIKSNSVKSVIIENGVFRIEYSDDMLYGTISDVFPANELMLDGNIETIWFETYEGTLLVTTHSKNYGRLFKSSKREIYLGYLLTKTKVL